MTRQLTDIFIVPPISVLDIKQKYWKERKKFWLSLGIESELGRKSNLLNLSSLLQKKHSKSTSVFDPVLTECMYTWFTEKNDKILDPFSGGSVRGIVASKTERNYLGYDIREEQIKDNEIQAKRIVPDRMPIWINDDSINIHSSETFDFIFTCPPYFDLERYSDDPRDLSNLSEIEFSRKYDLILSNSIRALKNNRFACIVVSNTRDKEGNYRDLLYLTKTIFTNNGCKLYNEMILLQEPATAAMRSFRFMNSSRKIAKCHQNCLVFLKGNASEATGRLSKFEE